MKNILFLVSCLIAYIPLQACDICGCAAGGTYMGVLPQYNLNLMGFRFQYNNTIHPSTNFNTNDLSSRVLEDRFYTTSAWMRLFPTKRLQFYAIIPYAVHQRVETQRVTTIQGIGDVQFDLNYTLVDQSDSIKVKWKNLLQIGGGVQLPTGKYQQRDNTKLMLPAAFQAGSGAYSISFNLMHTIRYKSWGLNSNARYSFIGENEISYNYGNQAHATFNFFYWAKYNNVALLPSVGLGFDYYGKDYQYDQEKESTGGTLFNLNAGMDIYINKLLINTFVQVPLSQDIPVAQAAANFIAGAGISMFFEKKQKLNPE